MSRDDDSEDEKPRRPRDRWAEDDSEPDYRLLRPWSSGRSGAVTALGVVTLILGSVVLLLEMCVGAGIVIASADQMNGVAGADPGAVLLILLVFVVIFLWGGGALASGIGLLGRRAWARVLTLILAGLGALGGLMMLVLAVAIWSAPHFAMGEQERTFVVAGSVFYLLLGFLLLGYCAWTFLVLLESRYAQEFR